MVSAYVGDRAYGWLHPWLIQLDQFGCFVPGCDKAVSNSDIQSGKEKAFKIYPNPVQDKLFLLSRITADHLNIQLLNIQGDIVLQNKISVSEGVQYIIDIPESLPSSTYILQIMDDKEKVWMSEKITKI